MHISRFHWISYIPLILDPDWENNSKLYLQELFGSFPVGDLGGDNKQDDNASDGEFQTYELDSDGDYSDE